jgi:hypothetical protein
VDERIEGTLAHFHTAHVTGGPYLFQQPTAFLSFLCTLSATEALAGYRYANIIPGAGERFRCFIENYFPAAYRPHAGRLWDFRNGMIHAFTPRRMSIIRGVPHLHLTPDASGTPILNAEDFFTGMLAASQAFIAELQQSEELQQAFLHRLASDQGGEMHVTVLGFGGIQ